MAIVLAIHVLDNSVVSFDTTSSPTYCEVGLLGAIAKVNILYLPSLFSKN